MIAMHLCEELETAGTGQRQIQQALDRLMEGRTTLIFAHRLSSVIGADRILVLDGGRVVESGTHGSRGSVWSSRSRPSRSSTRFTKVDARFSP